MKSRVTIKDIAAEAGVSTGTVHRALYGKKEYQIRCVTVF